ncbi:DUF1501 domain-containing protein [Schlesneria sp. DSM 10557]|uniref:DUF1501 domain-containing protein n=1 Tax=Schlesneria sp. DSM 10557 TaxID=3044399 RepID=UPI00359F87FC
MHFFPDHTRRHFLAQSGFGLSSLALTHLLTQEAKGAPAKPDLEKQSFDLLPKRTPHAPQANAMISLFMQGGPSHIDMFEPKPELDRLNGQTFNGQLQLDNAAEATSKLYASPWKFKKHGECGTELSELLPHLGKVVDDICLIRSMHTGVNNHVQSIWALTNGRIQQGRPSLGSWMAYGLGTENQNMPAFVVLTDPSGLPVAGVENWTNGWLPSLYQGTVIRPKEPRILNLDPPPQFQGAVQDKFLNYVRELNQDHLSQRPGEHDLAARISSYELAARMQTAAKEALDLSQETAETKELYGLNNPRSAEYGTRCLIARRLVERGVRFVQVHTGNQHWDHHGAIKTGLPQMCEVTDQPSAALVMDLKRRGLLDTTLVHWGGEMGRLPVIQNEKNIGRDHNTFGFSMWLAGGGVKGGLAYGATDEVGHHAVENVVNHFDYHATLLHLFGLDPEKLTFARPGTPGTLLDGQPGKIVWDILKRGQEKA